MSLTAVRSSRFLRLSGLQTVPMAGVATRGLCSYPPDPSQAVINSNGKVHKIHLNRPKVLNSLNLPMVRHMAPFYKNLYDEKDPQLFIMTGEGDKAFCAGGDVKAIALGLANNDPLSDIFFREEYQLNHMIGSMKHPQVAILDGITMGGGVGLSVHGQFRVATEKTVFAMPETAIGFFCDVGGTHFLPRLPNHLGTWLALTGARLKGPDVCHAGVATHFVNSARVPKLVEALESLETIHSGSVKEVLDSFCEVPKDSSASFSPNIQTIEKCFGADTVEDIMEKLGKVGDDFAVAQIGTIKKMCPTAVKVTLESLRRGIHLDLAQCLKMEFRMTQRFMTKELFGEGVIALLVDKRPAVWTPDSLDRVSKSKVQSFFEKLPEDKEWKTAFGQ